MFALILNNTVVQVSDNTFPVAPSLTWMDCSSHPGCKPGWIVIDGMLQEKPIPQLSQDDEISNHIFNVNNFIDIKANERNYHNALDCISYSQSTNATWKAEALAFIEWRDNVRASLESTLQQVQAGTIPLPTLDALIGGLPKITWP